MKSTAVMNIQQFYKCIRYSKIYDATEGSFAQWNRIVDRQSKPTLETRVVCLIIRKKESAVKENQTTDPYPLVLQRKTMSFSGKVKNFIKKELIRPFC